MVVMMDLIRGYPPIYKMIAQALDVSEPMTFAWGTTLYAPIGIHRVTMAHLVYEEAKGKSQMEFEKPEGWWRRYIVDPQFRLQQEVDARCVQMAWYVETFPDWEAQEDAIWLQAIGGLRSKFCKLDLTEGAAKGEMEYGYRRYQERMERGGAKLAVHARSAQL